MSLFSGDNEIGNILQDAVKLKSAQMGQKRRTYETWPYFVQHTIFHSEKEDFKAWRAMPFDEKIEKSEEIKQEGNKLFKEGKFSDAVDKYEEAASLFHYCYSTDPGWRKNNRGIDDDVLVLVDDTGSDADEKAQIAKLRLQCCLNLSQCKLKLDKFEEAVVAGTSALEMDPDNVKALYRRAEARVRPQASTAYDHDLAIKDLNKANQLDPTNKDIEKLLKTLRLDRQKQRAKDKGTFEGMFGRGEIYDEESMKAAEELKAATNTNHRWEGVPNDNEMKDLRKRIDDVSDDDPLEKRIADAELLRDLYERNDKEEEAKKLNDQIQNAKNALKAQQEKRAVDRSGFSNPTAEMIAEAQQYGLDLNDPVIKAELLRIEREGPGALDQMDGEELPPPAPPVVELLLPDVPEYVSIPWKRYFGLFGGIVLILRLWDIFMILQQLFALVRRLLSSSDDEAPVYEGGSGSIFARAYQLLFAAGSDAEF